MTAKIVGLVLMGFTAVTAILSGIALIFYPDGHFFQMSVTLLEHSPFNNFLIPGLVLCLVVGGSNLAGALSLALDYKWAGQAIFFGGNQYLRMDSRPIFINPHVQLASGFLFLIGSFPAPAIFCCNTTLRTNETRIKLEERSMSISHGLIFYRLIGSCILPDIRNRLATGTVIP